MKMKPVEKLQRYLHGVLLATLLVVLATGAHALPARAAPAAHAHQDAPAPIRFEGYLKAIGPGKWLIGDQSVLVNEYTQVIEKHGRAIVGAWVIVWGQRDTMSSIVAEIILVDRPAGRLGPLWQIAGTLRKQFATLWIIDQLLVQITPSTQIIGTPTLGSLLWVVAEPQSDMLRALVIEVIADIPEAAPFEFEGAIERFGDAEWIVDGHQILIDTQTVRMGEPVIGKTAEVQAIRAEDGRLRAHLIRVVDPATETDVDAMIAAISAEPDGTQTWEVIVFPREETTYPTQALIHIDANTLIDEGRAVAQAGKWAEMRGSALNDGSYQADVVRLEQPVPVSITGELEPTSGYRASTGWRSIAGQTVWLPSAELIKSATAFAAGPVRINGLRLGNGVIWVKSVQASGIGPR